MKANLQLSMYANASVLFICNLRIELQTAVSAMRVESTVVPAMTHMCQI